MNFGRLLAVIGGIITFAGTFWLSLFALGATDYAYAIGGIMKFSDIVAGASTSPWGDAWVVYLILVGYCVYLLSFIPQLLGGKSRISAFIGSLLPLTVGVMIMIYSLTSGTSASMIYNIMGSFSGEAIVAGWFPFHYAIGTQFEAIGTYAIIFGSLLALISSFIPRPDDY